MSAVLSLFDYQLEAIKKMKNGCILCGGVGSGKSRTALAYYYITQDGVIGTENCVPMGDPPKDLYIITTARKRDTLDWEGEMTPFLLSTNKEDNLYSNKVVVDSWNNIGKYSDVKDSFFIFDEQRVVGYGTWVKAFLSIAKKNEWILLSATPGDTWHDYIPVFIANGFYKNKTEFEREHAVYSRISKFPKVERYINTGKLNRLRNSILVNMDFERKTVPHHEDVYCDYDILGYKELIRKRWNIEKQMPIESASEFCYCLRKLVNSDKARQIKLLELLERHDKAIIFYNFDYELEILRALCQNTGLVVAEWNGHIHQPVPSGHYWAYLVQYTAGAEGWNCISTDTIIFYSQSYSYKQMIQAAGRIDRLTTPYTDLYYYHLKSRSGIDLAISRSLAMKKDFNSSGFAGRYNFKQSTGGK